MFAAGASQRRLSDDEMARAGSVNPYTERVRAAGYGRLVEATSAPTEYSI